MEERKKRPLLGDFILLLSAVIWGSAFVAQRDGMDSVGPFTFGCLRCALGALFLLAVSVIRDFFSRIGGRKSAGGDWLRGGVIAGVTMFIPVTLQQYGLLYTTSGKAGFITALYMVIVPIYMFVFQRRRIKPVIWAGIALAVGGMYVLCLSGGGGFNLGDALELAGAFFWALQIMTIDKYAPRADGLKLVMTECAVCSLLSLPLMLVFEEVSLTALRAGAPSIAYAGILSCGVAYALQPIGQRETSPAVATIMMSMESVFAALFGALILRESFSPRELAGCAMIFAAVLTVQLPEVLPSGKGGKGN